MILPRIKVVQGISLDEEKNLKSVRLLSLQKKTLDITSREPLLSLLEEQSYLQSMKHILVRKESLN